MECLVTKLKGTVNDNSLLKIGEFRIKADKYNEPWDSFSQSFKITCSETTTISIIGNGYFTDTSGTENKGTTLSTDTGEYFYIKSLDTCYLSISDKYKLTTLIQAYFNANNRYTKNFYINLDDLKYSYELESLSLSRLNVYGSIDSLKDTKIKSLYLSNCTEVEGNISNLPNNLEKLSISNTPKIIKRTNDIVSFTNLINLEASNSGFEGDVNNFSTLTLLKTLYVNKNSELKGNISGISTLTNLVNLNIEETGISGDLSGISSLVNLTELKLYNSQVTGDLGNLNKLIKLSKLTIANTSISGSINKLKCPLTTLSVNNIITGQFEEFVKTQRSAGRTTGNVTKNSWEKWGNLTLNGSVPVENTVSWTKTQITCGDTIVDA